MHTHTHTHTHAHTHRERHTHIDRQTKACRIYSYLCGIVLHREEGEVPAMGHKILVLLKHIATLSHKPDIRSLQHTDIRR